MVRDEKQIFIISLIISLVFHIMLVIIFPYYSFKVLEKKETSKVVEIKTKFVLIKKNEVKKVSKVKKDIKKEKIITKKPGTKMEKIITKKIETKPIKIKTEKLIAKSKVSAIKIQDLPKLEMPKREDSEFLDKLILPKNEKKVVINDFEIENKYKITDENIVIQDPSKGLEAEKVDSELDINDIEIETVILVQDKDIEIGDKLIVEVGEQKNGGITNVQLPEGISLEVAEGKGEAFWNEGNVLPTYPSDAEKNGWEGKVKLDIKVNEQGIVQNVFVEEKSGYFVLDRAAEKAAKQWKIIIKDNGVQIGGNVKVVVSFDLKR